LPLQAEFWEQAGHALVVCKARFVWTEDQRSKMREKFADALQLEGFFPCHADPCVWMRDAGDTWEHICIYVDNLATCLKDPEALFDVLTGPKHKSTS
jgi:hypothetical protein